MKKRRVSYNTSWEATEKWLAALFPNSSLGFHFYLRSVDLPEK